MSKWKKLMMSLNENDSEDHNYTDHEVSMARSQLLSVVKSATNIAKNLKDRNEDEGLEGWVASKLTMAEDYLQAVSDHMNGQAIQEGAITGAIKHVKSMKAQGMGKAEAHLKAKKMDIHAKVVDDIYDNGNDMDEGYKVMPPMNDKYQSRDGLEGPFSTLSGKVVYYDPKEGSYYDPDTDMYMTYDEFQNYDNDYSGMKDEQDEVKEAGLRPGFAKELRNAELNKDKGPAPVGKTTGPDDYDFLKNKNKKKKTNEASWTKDVGRDADGLVKTANNIEGVSANADGNTVTITGPKNLISRALLGMRYTWNFSKYFSEEVNEGIPKDTSYGVAVDGKYIAKGNKANMRRLAKNTEGGQLMNSPSKKVGDSVGKAVEEEKTRLDPKCWDNKKIGDPKTKMKNGVRVNNCVPK